MTTLNHLKALPKTSPAALVTQLRSSFDSGRTRPLAYRQQQLASLARFLQEHERDIEEALHHDLGKPATTKEGDDIADGLKSPVFKKASAEKPLRVNIYTAEEDDVGKGISRGDVVKILVNPERKKK